MYDRYAHIERCQRKKWFEDKEAAEAYARKMWTSNKWTLYSYSCHICNLWHLTSTKPILQVNLRCREREAQFREEAKVKK